MRLLDFLRTIDNASEQIIQVPLFYLGGSTQAYNDYLFESDNLTEASISRFIPIIQVFATIDEWAPFANIRNDQYATALKQLEWAMNVLKREDRIIWYMRIYKAKQLAELASLTLSDNENIDEQKAFIAKERGKAVGKLNKLYGNNAISVMLDTDNIHFYTAMEHFLSMNIPNIENTVWGNQTPKGLLDHFENIENEWMAKKDSVIDMNDDPNAGDVDVIINFPDGYQWVNLNRSSCSIEGYAMGHCGNSAANRSTETVLSLRQPVNERGQYVKNREENLWRPLATFILDHTNGMLGEMKGGNNQKPSDKLHPYIIALLKLDLIKGIVGGGYNPSNNFALDDLPVAVKTALLKEKPELGTLLDTYDIYGNSKLFRNKLLALFRNNDVDAVGYTTNKESLIIAEYTNVTDFISSVVPDDSYANTIVGYIFGDDYLEGDYYTGDLSDRQELAITYYKKYPNELEKLKTYMKDQYPDQFVKEDDDGYTENDIDDIDDIVSVLDDEGDDIYDQIGYAISDGYRAGAESEMHETFFNWVETPFENDGFSVEFDENDKYNGKFHVLWDLADIINLLRDSPDEEDFDYDVINWQDMAGFDDLQKPYYGFDGVDKNVALENFADLVEVPDSNVDEGVMDYITPAIKTVSKYVPTPIKKIATKVLPRIAGPLAVASDVKDLANIGGYFLHGAMGGPNSSRVRDPRNSEPRLPLKNSGQLPMQEDSIPITYSYSDPVGQKTFGLDFSPNYTSKSEDYLRKRSSSIPSEKSPRVTMPKPITQVPRPHDHSKPTMPSGPSASISAKSTVTHKPVGKKPTTTYKFDKELDSKVKRLLQRYNFPKVGK